MSKEPRTKLPWAGLLIILVAPLATLMVVVPSLFAGTVSKVETGVPAVINRVLPDVVPRPHAQPPVAQLPPASPSTSGAPPAAAPSGSAPAAATASGAAAPVGQAAAVLSGPALAITSPQAPVQHGRHRRRRPHQPTELD